MTHISDSTRIDTNILLSRALLGQCLVMFGADGFGLHGTSLFPQYHRVQDVVVSAKAKALLIMEESYDPRITGHAATDQNLTFSINQLLGNEFIPADCWTYADVAEQGNGYIMLDLDVTKMVL